MVTAENCPDLTLALEHLEAAWPNEGCGLILRAKSGAFRIVPMENAQDRYHQQDPERFPRTARTAYLFDPKEWLKVSEAADRDGEQVACVFHSHAEVGAYFSAEDRDMAAPEGFPVLPEASYLVVAVDGGKATAAKLFWWNGAGFDEADVSLKR